MEGKKETEKEKIQRKRKEAEKERKKLEEKQEKKKDAEHVRSLIVHMPFNMYTKISPSITHVCQVFTCGYIDISPNDTCQLFKYIDTLPQFHLSDI